MEVYLLTESIWEDTEYIGCFSTLDKACNYATENFNFHKQEYEPIKEEWSIPLNKGHWLTIRKFILQ